MIFRRLTMLMNTQHCNIGSFYLSVFPGSFAFVRSYHRRFNHITSMFRLKLFFDSLKPVVDAWLMTCGCVCMCMSVLRVRGGCVLCYVSCLSFFLTYLKSELKGWLYSFFFCSTCLVFCLAFNGFKNLNKIIRVYFIFFCSNCLAYSRFKIW